MIIYHAAVVMQNCVYFYHKRVGGEGTYAFQQETFMWKNTVYFKMSFLWHFCLFWRRVACLKDTSTSEPTVPQGNGNVSPISCSCIKAQKTQALNLNILLDYCWM